MLSMIKAAVRRIHSILLGKNSKEKNDVENSSCAFLPASSYSLS
jgi:hypothetical protein